MSYSSELTKERIIQCAKEEFLKKGFLEANLREIAANAKATTGAIYNHFKGKDGLFDAIVGDFAEELITLFTKLHDEVEGTYDFDSAQTSEDVGQGTYVVLDLLYQNIELSKLLFCSSAGTKYEKIVDEMIQVEEKSTLYVMEKENLRLSKINRFFIHVMSTSGINNMLEAIRHDLSREEALEYMSKIQRFYHAGSKEILGN